MALRPPSFTDMLPYISYAPDERIFVLRDGNTLGALFELSPIATEAMPIEILNEHAQKIQEALQAMPSVNGAPWIAQFFVNDDRNLDHLNDTFTDYILEQHKDDGLGQEILNFGRQAISTFVWLLAMAYLYTEVTTEDGDLLDGVERPPRRAPSASSSPSSTRTPAGAIRPSGRRRRSRPRRPAGPGLGPFAGPGFATAAHDRRVPAARLLRRPARPPCRDPRARCGE